MSKNILPKIDKGADTRAQEDVDLDMLNDWCKNTINWSKYVIFDTYKGVVTKEGRHESK